MGTKGVKMLCGIDEAGRGPVAGCLAIAGVVLHNNIIGIKDSKKLTQKRRNILYKEIIQNSDYHIVKFSAQDIDQFGLSKCISIGLSEIMQTIKASRYLFDGNTAFGVKNLETLIKADTKIAEVSAASILAKVTHDNDIDLLDNKYPQYGFKSHKGYATALHVKMIKKYGYCEQHRKSFKIKSLLV